MLSVAITLTGGASLLGFASVVGAQAPPPRFPDLPVLLRSPELADRVQKLGEHLRFHSTLPPRLNEFAILISLHGPERGGGAAARGRRLAVVSFVRHR